MNYKEALDSIEKLENGAELISAIKAETTRLNSESKRNRETGEKSSAKIKSLLESIGLDDTEDLLEKAKEMRSALDSYKAGGKSPDEWQKSFTSLTKQVSDLKKSLDEANTKAAEANAKRITAMKKSRIVDALTKNNVASPENVAKIVDDLIQVGENDSLSYRNGDKELSFEDGIKDWVNGNSWAVKVNGSGGSGGGTGGTANADSFLSGLKG